MYPSQSSKYLSHPKGSNICREDFFPNERAACKAGEYSTFSVAAVSSLCILSIAGMTAAVHGVSVENSSVTVLKI